jgi:SP family sugar porter-like MFS transporter
VIGILLAQIVNWLIAEPMPDHFSAEEILDSWNGQRGWRFMFWAEIIPATLFFILMWFVPESPRWLVSKQKEEKAKEILTKIGHGPYALSAFNEIRDSLRNQTQSVSLKALFRPGLAGVIFIGIVLAAFQQWCGINVIFMYAEEIFEAAGYSVSDMLFNIVITGSVNLVFTLVAMATVDKLGRKTLLLFGSAGLAVIYTVLGTFYFLGVKGMPMLILVVTAIACYAMTLAPVIWVVLSEIFPNRVRGAAMAVATFSLWIASTLLTFFFPIVNQIIQASGSFWLFALICAVGFFYIKSKLIETKGKTLEAIEKEIIHP